MKPTTRFYIADFARTIVLVIALLAVGDGIFSKYPFIVPWRIGSIIAVTISCLPTIFLNSKRLENWVAALILGVSIPIMLFTLEVAYVEYGALATEEVLRVTYISFFFVFMVFIYITEDCVKEFTSKHTKELPPQLPSYVWT